MWDGGEGVAQQEQGQNKRTMGAMAAARRGEDGEKSGKDSSKDLGA